MIKLEEADIEEQAGRAFRAMNAYVDWFESDGEKGQRALAMLRLMGLFDRPADAGCLEALWRTPAIEGLTEPLTALNDAQRNLGLTKLAGAKLVTVNRDAQRRVGVARRVSATARVFRQASARDSPRGVEGCPPAAL